MNKVFVGNLVNVIKVHYDWISVADNSNIYYKGQSISYNPNNQIFTLKYELIDNNNTYNNDEFTESYRNSIFFNQVSRSSEDRE